jgi:hypothetical protein
MDVLTLFGKCSRYEGWATRKEQQPTINRIPYVVDTRMKVASAEARERHPPLAQTEEADNKMLYTLREWILQPCARPPREQPLQQLVSTSRT